MHWLDIIFMVILASSAIHGYRSGAIDQVLSLGALLGAVCLSHFVVPYVVTYTGVTSGFWPWVIAFVVLWLALGFVRKALSPLLSISLGLLDKIGGAVVSLFVTAFVLGLLLQGWEQLVTLYRFPEMPDTLLLKDLLLDLSRTFWPDQVLLHRTTPDVGGDITTTV